MRNITLQRNNEKLFSLIESFGTLIPFKKGEVLFNVNQPMHYCYYLKSGRIKVYADHANGKRTIIDFFGKEDWIGEHSIFIDEKQIKEHSIIESGQAWQFEIKQLREFCLNHPKASFYFSQYFIDKHLNRTLRMSSSMNYPLEQRLAAFILEYQQDNVYKMPHTEVSEYLSVSYRHVLHVMRHFCDLGILERKQGYLIKDMKRLRMICEQEINV